MMFRKTGFLFLLLTTLLISCKNEVAKTTQICVLIDVTDEKFQDKSFVSENLPKYLKLMHLDKNTGGFPEEKLSFH